MNNMLILDPQPDFQFIEQVFNNLDVLESTRAEYAQRVQPFLAFIRGSGFHRNSFLEFKRELRQRNDLSVSTKNKRLTAARIMLKELNRLGHLPADITQNVKSFQQSKKHKRVGLNQLEVDQLSVYLQQSGTTPQLLRIKAILSLLLLQGLRQIEVIRLDVKDLDLVSLTALIRGKGRDDKEPIDLHPQTVNVLTQYMQTQCIADGPLFTSLSNNSYGQRLTTRGLRKIVKAVLKDAGVNKHVHGCRHYFTTKLIEIYRGDLLEVARYTRHKSLEMLQVYNDAITKSSDLPRFYAVFEELQFQNSLEKYKKVDY